MDTEQVTSEKKLSAEDAIEFSVLFAMLAASGIPADEKDERGHSRRAAVLGQTFTEFLGGLGYKVVPK